MFPSQPIVSCADLVETNFGDFESKTYEELKDNPAYQSFLESGGTKAFPNGESAQEMTKRVWASFCQWIKTMSDEGYNDISFVIHGGPIMAIMFSLMPQSNFYDWHCTNGRGWRFNIKGNQRFEKATIEKIS